jgi:hypothetical protein
MTTARRVQLLKLGWQVWAVMVSVLALVLLAGTFALTW